MAQEPQQRQSYPSELTDEQWARVEPLLPAPRSNRGGRPRAIARREVLNPLLSLHRRGGQWDLLPQDLLPTSRGSDYCAQWRDEGTGSKLLAAVREQGRREAGREPTPSAACLASHSVQTPAVGGKERGDDGGKKITGRQRHVLVAPLGLLRAVVSTSAQVEEGAAAPAVLAQVSLPDFPRWETLCGAAQSHTPALAAWVAEPRPGGQIAVKLRPPARTGCTPVRKRGVVERTKAGTGRSRRNSTDSERKPESAAALSHISHLHLLLRKLPPSAQREFRYDAAA